MKNLAVILLVLVLSGCDKYGEIINEHGMKLVSIDYEDEGECWTENFTYDADNNLVEINDTKESGGYKYISEFENGKIKQVRRFDAEDNRELDRDSIAYNQKGQMVRVYSFYFESMEPDYAIEYVYNPDGYLDSSKFYIYSTSQYWIIEKYYWENDNVTRIDEFWDGELYYELFFTYDDKVNYKRALPYLLQQPIAWASKNNLISGTWNDYQGNYEGQCRGCEIKYNYNLDGHPVKILYPSKRQLKLLYE